MVFTVKRFNDPLQIFGLLQDMLPGAEIWYRDSVAFPAGEFRGIKGLEIFGIFWDIGNLDRSEEEQKERINLIIVHDLAFAGYVVTGMGYRKKFRYSAGYTKTVEEVLDNVQVIG